MPLDPARTVAELRELRELTGDENGAQRVAWTGTWSRAKEWLEGKLAGTGAAKEVDEAGNEWYTLPGRSEGNALLIGGHIDSVPNGGWLDGCLNVMAGVEVLRRIAADGSPPVPVRLVNWADEEGARFGRSLFGSSAAGGSIAAGERGGLPRAPHRAGAGARVDGLAARGGAGDVRRRAFARHLARAGRARRVDADGQASRRARGRGEARARDPVDRARGR
jgi:N-carbamoyl-L-amino-acid hydrolase